MLGTLGSFLKLVFLSSLFLRFLFSPAALPSALVDAEDAGTVRPAAMSLDPLSAGFEGFEEEHRRWWPRVKTEAAFGAEAMSGARPLCGAEVTTRRTEGSMTMLVSRCRAMSGMEEGKLR